jgi:glycosyltransferase involved in cell wall biosynthesis
MTVRTRSSGLQAARPRLLHVTSDTGRYGGKDAVVFTLLTRLKAAGEYDVEVVCFRREIVYREFVGEGIPVHVLKMYWTFDLSALGRLASVVRDRRVDLIHTHDNKSHFLGRVVGRRLGIPVISTFHGQTKFGLELNIFKRTLYHWLVRKTDGLVTRFIAVSSELRNELLRRGIEPCRISHIPNGIDADQFLASASAAPSREREGLPDEAYVVGIVGRLSGEKGHRHFLEAVAPLCRERRNLRCLVVGDGPLRAALESDVTKLGIREQVVFAGFRRDIATMYALMDVVVLPSLGEGLPVTLLEAMAMGKPMVATRVGGVPEVIDDGRDGLIVPPANSDSLRVALDRMLQDTTFAERLGRAAAEKVRTRFSADLLARRTTEVYRQVLG